MVSPTPQCTHGIPPLIIVSPSILNNPCCSHDISHNHHGIPWCTHGILPLYLTSLGVLMISPRCTKQQPLVYLVISPSILDILCCTADPPVYCTDIMQGGKANRHFSKMQTIFYTCCTAQKTDHHEEASFQARKFEKHHAVKPRVVQVSIYLHSSSLLKFQKYKVQFNRQLLKLYQ